jgi:hypothetical protein
MFCDNLIVLHRSVDFVLVTFRESILDKSTQGKRFLSRDVGPLICTLLSASDFREVKIFLKKNVWVIVHLSGLNSEATLQRSFMTMIETELVGILLTHARVTAIKGQVCVVHFGGWMSEGEEKKE